MKSILIVSEAFTAGGLETHIRGEIDCLSAQSWTVHLACGVDFSDEFLSPFTASVCSGLQLGPNASLDELYQSVETLRALIRAQKVDLVHVHPYTSLIPAMIAAAVEGIPAVVTVHGPSLMDGTYGSLFDFLLDHVLLPSAGQVFAVSDEVQSVLAPFLTPARLTVLPNAVAIDGMTRPAPDPGNLSECWLVACRLDRLKLPGVVAFLRFAHAAGIPCVHVAGAGPAQGHLQIELHDLGLDDFVINLGLRSNLSSLMAGYRGVAGMGRVVLESLAADRPTCLIGYDGVKGFFTQQLFRQAAWSNFSGRGLPNIGATEFARQLREEITYASGDYRALLTEQHEETAAWDRFSNIVRGLEQPESGYLADLYGWIATQQPPGGTPYLRSQQLLLRVGRLASSPRYASKGLGDSFVHALGLVEFAATHIAEQEAQQSVGLLENEIQQLRSTLEGTKEKLTQQDATLQKTTRVIGALERQSEALRSELMNLSDWAATIDRDPLRHAIRKAAVSARRKVLRALPLSAGQRQRLRNLVRRAYSKPTGIGRHSVKNSSARLGRLGGTPIVEAVPGRRDILMFAVIDWHFRFQRPQQMATSFARRGIRVFYISNQFIDSSIPGYAIEPLDPGLPIYQVRLNVSDAPAIYYALPTQEMQQMILADLGQLLFDYGVSGSYVVAHHPFWQPMIWRLPNCIRVYDCMDHHEGFGNVPDALVEAERTLLRDSDLVITTSSWLENSALAYNRQVAVIRNAADYAFFSQQPDRVFADSKGRKVAGYYGAIAEWLDIDLIRSVARSNPDVLVLLVGSDTIGASRALGETPNVTFTGEVPYQQLPFYLYGFDVCLLPFMVIPLTLATNPVKVYEYLSAGRPVIGTELPELAQFGNHVIRVHDPREFALAVKETLSRPITEEAAEARRAFAREQTWEHRATAFYNAARSVELPRISVIVLTFNNLDLTRSCVDSVFKRTDYPNLEVILVDNCSTDGTPSYLRALQVEHPEIKVILNERNLGFAAGNNKGLAEATGDYLALLNNDTVVTDGWASTLMRHLQRDPEIGIIGPVTDNIGNEARIEIDYPDLDAMHGAARRLTLARLGKTFEVRTLAFFCVMLPRRTYEDCGSICADYGIGFFEDDDYCRRVEKQGLRILCAEDVFVHHHLSASFSKLSPAARDELFKRNQAIYEEKWGTWIPHQYR